MMIRFRCFAAICLLVPLLQTSCSVPTGPGGHASLMQVNDVRFDPRTASPVILLEEDDGRGRHLLIWIGAPEARSIALAMEGVPTPRPNSHDLIENIVRGIDAKVSRVVITELRGGTFYAILDIEAGGQMLSIDARPSDAIAVAMRTGAPVFASESVLRKAGVLPNEEDDKGLDTRWHRERAPRTLFH